MSGTQLHIDLAIRGRIDRSWSAQFAPLELHDAVDGLTHLEGHLPDQSAVHAFMCRLRDLGLPLERLTIQRVGQGEAR